MPKKYSFLVTVSVPENEIDTKMTIIQMLDDASTLNFSSEGGYAAYGILQLLLGKETHYEATEND